MKALLKNYRQSPRKTRLVADMIRGKSVSGARAALAFTPKKASLAMGKLLESAVANAKGQAAEAELFVKTITVDKGQVLKRARPFARGRAGRIHKAASIVRIELGTLAAPTKQQQAPKKAAAKKKAVAAKA